MAEITKYPFTHKIVIVCGDTREYLRMLEAMKADIEAIGKEEDAER